MGSFVLAGIVLTGAWTQLDVIGWPAWILPALIFVLDSDRFRLPGLPLRKPVGADSATAIALAALLCAMHLAHVVLTAREEFGFGGDEGYHLSATRAFAIYFMKAGPYLAGVVALFAVIRFAAPRWAATAATIGLIGASYLLPQDALFGRYPTGFYLLALPLNVAMDVAKIPYPFTANHIVNMLSLPAWLFVLRPLVLGRWPDWRVLPIALLIYFQGASIVYVSSGLLEPWSFVFVLLALEGVVVLDADRRWIAVLLAGAATFFKDTTILFVPPIWFLAMVDWQAWRPALRRHAFVIGLSAVAPFLVYFAARRGLHIVRGYEVAASAGVWTVARATEWIANARVQLGIGGSIVISAVTAWCAFGWIANRQTMRAHVIWFLTAVALVIFFAADVASIPFTGYGRFLAYPLLAVCGALFMTTHALANRRMLIGLSATIALLQLSNTASVFALDFKPDYERNSLEWAQGLVRFPIRSLADRLPGFPGGAVRRVRVIAFGIDLISLRVAYPDLARRYDLAGEMQPPTAPDCGCTVATDAVLAGFEWPAHFADTLEGRNRYEQQQSACVAQIRATCAATAFEQRPSGEIIGAVGAGVRAR